jgi:hypothetical protein
MAAAISMIVIGLLNWERKSLTEEAELFVLSVLCPNLESLSAASEEVRPFTVQLYCCITVSTGCVKKAVVGSMF